MRNGGGLFCIESGVAGVTAAGCKAGLKVGTLSQFWRIADALMACGPWAFKAVTLAFYPSLQFLDTEKVGLYAEIFYFLAVLG